MWSCEPASDKSPQRQRKPSGLAVLGPKASGKLLRMHAASSQDKGMIWKSALRTDCERLIQSSFPIYFFTQVPTTGPFSAIVCLVWYSSLSLTSLWLLFNKVKQDFINYLFKMCVCVRLCWSVCAPHVCSAWGGQKRAHGTLGLVWLAVVSCQWCWECP